jgi:hypothetical protein
MITHVKKNAQRATYTRLNYIKCAVLSKGIESKVNCSKIHQTSLKKDVILSQYLIQREEECRRYLFGGL